MTANANLSVSPTPKQIIESAGAIYIGIQETLEGPLHCFNDPVNSTTLALYDRDLSELAVIFVMLESRRAFRAAAMGGA